MSQIPPGPSPVPGRNPLTPWVITVAVMLAVVLVGGGALLLTGDDDEPGTGSSEPTEEPTGGEGGAEGPEAAMDEFIAANLRRDCGAMLDVVTEDFILRGGFSVGTTREEAMERCESSDGGFDAAVVYSRLEREGQAELDGETATVEAAGGTGLEIPDSVTFELVRTDDGWKIDDFDFEGDDPDDSPSGPSEPVEVVDQYIVAAGDHDCEAIVELVTDNLLQGQTRGEALTECESLSQEDLDAFRNVLAVGDAEIDGDTATVVRGVRPYGFEFTLVKQGATWLIEGIDT